MTKLAQQKCEACRADSPQTTPEEANDYLKQAPGWQVVREDNINKLSKTYSFKNWNQAIAFTNQVGELAEEHGHHPAILTEWGRVNVKWWTHKIGGLHKNDFIMAAKCEDVARVLAK
ncbi:MAG: 4a-hydroxytetrahydrobiopterin dehydratase [Longimicrobiales bacterium]